MGSDLCGAHPSTVRPQSQREKETLWLKRSRSTLDLGFSLWPLHCLTPVLPDHGLDSWVWWYLSAFSLVYSPANTVQYHSVFLKVYQKATLGISSCFAMVLTPTHQDVSKITFCWITKGWIKKTNIGLHLQFVYTVCVALGWLPWVHHATQHSHKRTNEKSNTAGTAECNSLWAELWNFIQVPTNMTQDSKVAQQCDVSMSGIGQLPVKVWKRNLCQILVLFIFYSRGKSLGRHHCSRAVQLVCRLLHSARYKYSHSKQVHW